ncbi:MAG: thioredoxin family protein, partial [Desulfatirhabdiaceae bacterium]|nr:thioredoxin family protein [Desulfatirhabdiaceae bacterium]
MKAEEERQIILFNSQLSQDIQLRLVKTRHDASRTLEAFCTALQQAAPKIRVKFEKEDSDTPPELRIHSRICYRSVPLGHELGPFLKSLSLIFNSQISPPLPIPPRLNDLAMPAELKLYVAEQCPFCPGTVESLLPLALSSVWVRLTVIDAGLFLEEARSEHIQSVPTLVLDSQFRWTGTIKIQEVVEAMIHRDPSRLEADTLMNMIADGNAGLLANMMLEKDMVFPALVELLVHPKWPVRLGAMVAMETVAAEKPALAQKMVAPLWDRFDAADEKVKGDILYLVGEVDTGDSLKRIQDILNRKANYEPEIIEAAEE